MNKYVLPLSDADRAVLRLHAIYAGKSPALSDESLVALYEATADSSEVKPAPAAPATAPATTTSEVTAEQVAEALRRPVTERLVEAARTKVMEAATDAAKATEKAAIEAAEKAAREVAEKHRTVRYEIKVGDAVKKLPDGHRHPLFEDVLTAVACRENVYLVGPAGSGKTTLTYQVAEALGLPYYQTGAVGMAYQLLGFINAEGKYMETDLYKAFTQGGLFTYDEIDASSAQALLAFNAIMDNALAAFPCGVVKRHPDFVIVAAANTFGNGADAQYVGRSQLDAATLNRFVRFEMNYDEELENKISPCPEWTAFVQTFRKAVMDAKMRHIVSPRASIKGGKLLAAGMKAECVAEALLFAGLTDADRAKLPKVPKGLKFKGV